MSTESPVGDESPAVECFAECPHFEGVAGACTHEFNQTLIRQFIDNPGATCPIYAEWRAEEMATLAQRLESDGGATF